MILNAIADVRHVPEGSDEGPTGSRGLGGSTWLATLARGPAAHGPAARSSLRPSIIVWPQRAVRDPHSDHSTSVRIMATRSGSASALLVVDVQVGVVDAVWERDRIVGNVALAVRRAREAAVPVVWIQHSDHELKPGTPQWEWVSELQPMDGEARVQKAYNSAFEDTQLLAILDARGVSRVFLAGAATNWCIRATAYAALDRGFDVTLLSDAHTTESIELGPGRVLEARSLIDDLNIAMQWLSYPGRVNTVAPVAEANFGASAVSA